MKVIAPLFTVLVMVLAFAAAVPWLAAAVAIVGLGFVLHLAASRYYQG